MFDKRLELYQLDLSKRYLLANEKDIFEDEYDYLESISSEYLGIKDNIEEWENQMLEENTEWLTGEEIGRRLKK